jgi:ABC-type nitrate/sulfonate/bicarbonate transport system substrate-binding protein
MTNRLAARVRGALAAFVVLLLTSACTAAPAASQAPIEWLGNATSMPAIVGDHEGIFTKHGLSLKVTTVGFAEQDSLFATGNYPLTAQSPWDVAKAVLAGDNLKFVNTTAGPLATSLLIVRAADKDKYKTYKDLKGAKIGVPGFGTATWGAFTTILKTVDGIEAKSYFQPVEADSPTLVALLDQKQIEAALPFAQVGVLAQSQPDKYQIIFDMVQYWKEKTGQVLLLGGLTARGDWLDKNADKVKGLVAGLDEAGTWIKANASKLYADPFYGPFMKAGGVGDQRQADAWAGELAKGYYGDSSMYTQAWIDNQMKFINDGVGALIDKAPPPADKIFYKP